MSKSASSKEAGNPYALSLAWIFSIQGIHTLNALNHMVLPESLAKGGHIQFLTNISYVATFIYFWVSVVYHLSQSPTIGSIKKYFSAVAVCLECIVATVYWSLRLFAPELIVQKNQVVPLDVDLLIHAMPIAFLLIDYFYFCERWQINNFVALLIMSTLTAAYWFWLQNLIGLDGVYPYPFLNVPVPQRAVIFAAVGGVAYIFFLACKYLHPVTESKISKSKKTL